MIEWIGVFFLLYFGLLFRSLESLFAYCSVFILGYFIYIVLLRYGAVNNIIQRLSWTFAALPPRARQQSQLFVKGRSM
jgi:hypothetical protein